MGVVETIAPFCIFLIIAKCYEVVSNIQQTLVVFNPNGNLYQKGVISQNTKVMCDYVHWVFSTPVNELAIDKN